MAKSAKAPSVSVEAEAVRFAKVTNKRQGPIMCGPHGGLAFAPGVTVIELSALTGLPPDVQDSLEDMVSEGWLSIDQHDPDAPAPAPVVLSADPPPADPRPTLEQIAASTSAADLDAWFHLPGLSPELSEAILARHSALSPA